MGSEMCIRDSISRFLSTRLSPGDFGILIQEVRKNNLLAIATPFDEESVDLIEKLGIDVIKIGSPSASDWPLLERVVQAKKPVICSTGGLSLKAIDNIVSFFEEKGVDFALMHCVGIYPTPKEKLQLNQIELLRSRYPHITVGFSTHEEPDNFDAIKIAYAKGARLFERHVGVETEEIKLNAYSSTPEQIKKWLESYKEAIAMCGAQNRSPTDHEERRWLNIYARGVFARKDIKAGTPIKKSDVFFAMPLLENQMKSSDWKDGFLADRDYQKNEPLAEKLVQRKPMNKKEMIHRVMLQIKGMLNQARVVIGDKAEVELSHHYGLERFREFGAVIINCINRDYCKKLIIQLPRQKHPYHYHKKKEESFQVLYGDCLLYTSPSPRDLSTSRMPSSA